MSTNLTNKHITQIAGNSSDLFCGTAAQTLNSKQIAIADTSGLRITHDSRLAFRNLCGWYRLSAVLDDLDSNKIVGGIHQAANLTQLNSQLDFPSSAWTGLRAPGMLGYTTSDGKYYKLENDLATWTEILQDGVTGIQGETGAQGDQGETGAPGPTGAQGETGVEGTQGETGVEGTQGETGVEGTQGETGVEGTQGETGVEGTQGETGVEGTQGETGVEGTQGETGASGAVSGFTEKNVAFGASDGSLEGEAVFQYDKTTNKLNVGTQSAGLTGYGVTGVGHIQSIFNVGQMQIQEPWQSINEDLKIFCAQAQAYDSWSLKLSTAGDAHYLKIGINNDGTADIGTDDDNQNIYFSNPIRLYSGAPTTPSGGTLVHISGSPSELQYYDGANYRVISDGSRYRVAGASQITIDNTTTETNLHSGSLLFRETNPRAGVYYEVYAAGIYSSAASAGTFTIRLYDASTLLASNSFTMANDQADQFWELRLVINTRTVGASGDSYVYGAFNYMIDSDDSLQTLPIFVTAASTSNTSSLLDVKLTGQWGTADASNTFIENIYYAKEMFTL